MQKDCTIATRLLQNPSYPLLDWISSQSEPLTLFLPTDEAFAIYLEVLTVDQADLYAFDGRLLNQLMRYHLLHSAITTSKMHSKQRLPTALPGYNLTVTKNYPAVYLTSAESSARVIRANLMAGKGIVHVVDRVLVPFDLYAPPALPDYATLGDALHYQGLTALADVIGKSSGQGALLNRTDLVGTLFAPTDKAFDVFMNTIEALVEAGTIDQAVLMAVVAQLATSNVAASMVLFDHVHLGEGLLLRDLEARTSVAVGGDPSSYSRPDAPRLLVSAQNGTLKLHGFTSANILKPDILVGAGGKLVVHTVGGVLLTFDTALALGLIGSDAPAPPPRTTQFDTLLEAMQARSELVAIRGIIAAAGMTDLLRDPTTVLTLFAPSNEALLTASKVFGSVDVSTIPASILSLIIGDHVHIGQRLLAQDLSTVSGLPVGADPAGYTNPEAAVMLTANSTGLFVTSVLGVAKVTQADITAGASVIHVINGLLMTFRTAKALQLIPADPAPSPSPTASPSPSPSPSPTSSPLPWSSPSPSPSDSPSPLPIPSREPVIQQDLSFDNLTQALTSIDNLSMLLDLYNTAAMSPVGDILTSLLQGNFTLFAPTDEAFSVRLAATNTTMSEIKKNPIKIAALILPHLHFGEAIPLAGLTDGLTLSVGHVLLATSMKTIEVVRSGDVVSLEGPSNTVGVVISGITVGPSQIHIVNAVVV